MKIKLVAYDPEDNEMYEPLAIGLLESNLRPLRLCKDGNRAYKHHKLLQYIGIKDKEGTEIFVDDILEDNEGKIFRIYSVPGGFVFKANYWRNDCKDLVATDDLIIEPLSYPQNASWITSNCKIVGNIYQNCII